MPKGPLSASEFVSTEWSTAAEKAAFGNTLLHFLDADCPRELFTKRFYTRLSMTFGNIAHYNLEGFYGTWFTRDRHRHAFVEKILRWPCHGDPQFTFCDVERAVQRIAGERNYLARFALRAAEQLRAAGCVNSSASKRSIALRNRVRARPLKRRQCIRQHRTPLLLSRRFRHRSVFSDLSERGAAMGYNVYYRGEIQVSPPLTK
jgi:hypothetical protein